MSDVLNPVEFQRICEGCDTEFTVAAKWKRNRFCSRSCANSRPRCKRPESDRFWEKVNKNGPIPAHKPELGQCWVWTKYRNPKGYGEFGRADGSLILAHRWAYEQEYSSIPSGLEPDHLCRNPSCVRPDHQEAVTRSVNVQRGLKGDLKPPTPLREVCANGHLMTPDNRYLRKDGPREKYGCRQCSRNSSQRYYDRTRGVA